MATAKELQHFLEVLPYGEENNSFGLVGWQWCTTTDDPNVGQVSLIEDAVIKDSVVEVSCAPEVKSRNVFIKFPDEKTFTGIGSSFPIANLQLKTIGMETGVEISCKSDKGDIYTILAVTSTSLCKFKDNQLTIPLVLVDGWNRICIDMEHMMSTIGQKFVSAEGIKVYSCCRVRRIFFSDSQYDDWELPYRLRVLPILEKQFKEIQRA